MCIPYIKLLPDSPPPRKRTRTGDPKAPLSSESTDPHPVIVSLSPRLVYAPSSSRSNSHRAPTHRRHRPSAPHPSPATPQAEFAGGFEAGYQLSEEEREQRRLAAEERKAEEGRAGPPESGLQPPPLQQPLVLDPRQYPPPQIAPQVQQQPAQQPVPPILPLPPAPAQTTPQREHTRSPYSYIRRPPPHYRNRSRSRSSSDSSISRRSFEALRRRVNALSDRLTRLERWKEEVLTNRLNRLERWKEESGGRVWSLGPEGRRRREADRGRGRGGDVDVRKERRGDADRWDWEGGGLGRR